MCVCTCMFVNKINKTFFREPFVSKGGCYILCPRGDQVPASYNHHYRKLIGNYVVTAT